MNNFQNSFPALVELLLFDLSQNPTIQSRLYCPNFIDEETEAQRDKWLAQGHMWASKQVARLGLKLGLFFLKSGSSSIKKAAS